MAELQLFDEDIAEIAARLDLREPNEKAVSTINAAVSQFYDVEENPPPFEAVIDSATGVGKTYVLTGAMELFVRCYGVRDFVIVTPGTTILEKTRNNFTPGHPKSLLGPMSFQPVVVTAENFPTPVMRAAMDDETQVKVYLFTVQSLIRPETKTARKTHEFQEGLGAEFYARLQSIENLVVFADEHHCYYGDAFSKAIRDLNAWVLLGLTATPHKKTPKEQIIFQYPLAAAIADKLVKTPVIVGRKDDRKDDLTKLTDGVTLLRFKEEAIKGYAAAHEVAPANPVMLVIAKDIAEADEYGAILASSEFFGGAYADSVLVVHSSSPDEALEKLDEVERPDSPVRIIISVGMLKEGWDVSNVYVVASMRANVSEILTEQTLGRGMRLPFGKYTEMEILDTLEVVAHERYEELLKKRNVLSEAFIDYRSWAALRTNAQGETVAVIEHVEASPVPIISTDADGKGEGSLLADGQSGPVLVPVEYRAEHAGEAAARLKATVGRKPDAPLIKVPVLRMTAVQNKFSLADITDYDPFRKAGAAIAADPEGELSRTLFSARIVTDADGMKHTQLVRSPAVDHVQSQMTLFPLEELRTKLVEMVLMSSSVEMKASEYEAVVPVINSFFDGLGSKAEEILSAYLDRAGARLVRLVAQEQRKYMSAPKYDEVVELRVFDPVRTTDREVSDDRLGPFKRSFAYEGWQRSIFELAWFDTEPERRIANMVDDDQMVTCWVRLHINDLPILWNSTGQKYNPDLIVIENDGTHWVVEAKMDKEISSDDVLGKREAAKRWANYVNADKQVDVRWRYLLVSQSDIESVKGSWTALKLLDS